jgi:hypothetical protein
MTERDANRVHAALFDERIRLADLRERRRALRVGLIGALGGGFDGDVERRAAQQTVLQTNLQAALRTNPQTNPQTSPHSEPTAPAWSSRTVAPDTGAPSRTESMNPTRVD